MKRILMVLFVIALMCTLASANGEEEKLKALYKTFHLNPYTVVVTCKDGMAPKVEDFNSTGAVFVTCRDGQK